ncbi:helicase [Salipiger sp. CCB-MM3]|nr:helicase [Salipiger sp. CCB-MM3]
MRDLIRDRVEHLRVRLLDSSRRNPLIQIPFRQNSSTLIRFVDELPDVLARRLAAQSAMRLVPLPSIDKPLPDEATDEFLEMVEIARVSDELYLEALAELDPAHPDYAQKELDLERAMKDRVRDELGLPERQTAENPSLAAHARAHNISPDYLLPLPYDVHDDGRHEDADIQTLLLPDRLDRVGRSLHDRGHSFERETGVNVLHAAFGVLEWNEPGSSRAPAQSPLLLLEVKMSRRKTPGGNEYHICGENELEINTTLAQTLEAEFGLALPAYEGGSIERYFETIQDLAPAGWHWALRREALVGVFPSSRIAMYRDLDPEKSVVTESPIIEKMLATAGGDGAVYADVYDTDDPEVERRVPRLVMDADASQFSTLVDIANGNNVAIEGPPGSGKSQTIVNLIASAMADGKKVLFVAEKLTALDVVRNRLDAAGLGEFILPLQAGRGSRDAVFQSLDDRLKMEPPASGSAQSHKARHDALVRRRSDMQSYLEMLGTKLGDTGQTVHEALGRTIATAEFLDGLPREIRRIQMVAPELMNADTREEIAGDIRMVVDRLNDADQIAAFWREVGKAPLRNDEAEDLSRDFAKLAGDIEALLTDTAASALKAFLPEGMIAADEALTTQALMAIAGNPNCDAGLAEALLDPSLQQEAHEVCEARESATAAEGALQEALKEPDADGVDDLIREAGDFAERNGGRIDPSQLAQAMAEVEANCEALKTQLDLAVALPARWAETAEQDGTTLADIRLDIEMLLRAPENILKRRTADDARAIPASARSAATTLRKLESDLQGLRNRLPRAGDHDTQKLKAAAVTIETSNFLRIFSSSYKEAWTLFSGTLGGERKAERRDAVLALRDYAAWAERRDAFTGDARLAAELGNVFSGMTTDGAALEALASFHDNVARISKGDERLRYALETGNLDSLHAFADAEAMPARTLSSHARDITETEERIAELREDHRAATSFCLSFKCLGVLDAEMIDRARFARADLARAEERARSSRAAELLGNYEDTREIRVAILVSRNLSKLPNPMAGIELLRKADAADIVDGIQTLAYDFFRTRSDLCDTALWIANDLALDCAEEGDEFDCLKALAPRTRAIKEATSRPEGLVERARLLRAVAALEQRGLKVLTDWAQSDEGREHRAVLPQITEAILARNLTDHVQDKFGRVLDARDGADLDRLRSEIAQIDRELTTLSRAAIREELIDQCLPPAGNGTGKVGTFTQMSLIRHELGKSRNRIGVRDLTGRAGRALIELKPCWMMSPLAVAQYLHGKVSFDLAVIDEASQMTPENALGAIMRAKQVVIVGDTKQLPPTSFFAKVLDEADEDEDIRSDSESILDMANTSFTPVRQLRWHYRSRHPDLIAISNKMIYDEKLTIFPAARDGDAELGVELVEVAGEYRKGRNIPEARAIVAGAIEHMREHPDRSLGLATMNKDQTEIIVSEFERERARHPHVEAYIERWAEKDDGLEEFFVKNLETIQGDERDVIMISTLYGPEAESGKVYQRFGPVNSAHGHRRLNVLFSRAKEKIVTYSSMKPTDIQADGKAKGVAMLRAWLEFSKTGQIGQIEGEGAKHGTPDSPFESFVISQVEAAGFEAVPQVGASGFRIDIGVRHPDWPYGFILAIECDGAPYHSSRSSRDRDRLRQQVLEGLGWHFHRIWSTDWFRDPRGQIARLRDALHAALERAKSDEIRRREERAEATERARLEIEASVARAHWEAEEAVALAEEVLEGQKSQRPARRGKSAEDAVAKSPQGLLFGDADFTFPGGASLAEQAMSKLEAHRESHAFDRFNRSATLRKRGFYWLGFLEGVAASEAIEEGEIEAMINEACEIDAFLGFTGEDTIGEALNLALAACGDDVLKAIKLHAETIAASLGDPEKDSEKDLVNTFLGFCAGVVCDGQITSEEARKIHARFHSEPVLAEAPIFASLRWAVDGALADAELDEAEAEELREWIAALVTDGHADTGVANIGGVIAPTDPISDPAQLSFDGKTFVLTGKMSIGPRSLIGAELTRRGAVLKSSVTDETDFIVVATTASRAWKTTHFGTKIEAARGKIADGHPMRFVTERALAEAFLTVNA